MHKGGRAAEGRPAPFVEAAEGRLHYVGAGVVENIPKAYANEYRLLVYVSILPISLFSPYVGPGAPSNPQKVLFWVRKKQNCGNAVSHGKLVKSTTSPQIHNKCIFFVRKKSPAGTLLVMENS